MKFIATLISISSILAQNWSTIKSGQDNMVQIWAEDGMCFNIASNVQEVDTPKNILLQFFKDKGCQDQAHVVAWGKAKRDKNFHFQSVRAYVSATDNGGITGKEGDIYDTRTD